MRLRGVVLPSVQDQQRGVLADWKIIDPAGVRVPDGPVPVYRDFDTQNGRIGAAMVRLDGEQLVAEVRIADDAYLAGDKLCIGIRVREATHPGTVSLSDLIMTGLCQQSDPPDQSPLEIID